MAQAGPTAQAGTDHWRPAVMCTFAGIFVVSLAGGLVGGMTGGTGAPAASSHRSGRRPLRQRRLHAGSPTRPGATGPS